VFVLELDMARALACPDFGSSDRGLAFAFRRRGGARCLAACRRATEQQRRPPRLGHASHTPVQLRVNGLESYYYLCACACCRAERHSV
jgi:hypothetical protein